MNGTPPAKGTRNLKGRPPLLAVLVGIVTLQGLALAVWAVIAWLALLGEGEYELIVSGIALGLLLLAFAFGLLMTARALWLGYRWPRAAAVAWQLLSGMAGASMLGSGQPFGLLLLIPNIAVLLCMFTPRVLAYTEGTLGGSAAGEDPGQDGRR